MSGYRTLHREQVLDTALWKVTVEPTLSSSSSSSGSASAGSQWRIWAASADGAVRSYRVQEKSLAGDSDAQDPMDASALRLQCTHVLLSDQQFQQHKKQQSNSDDEHTTTTTTALGCMCVSSTRNYVGDDPNAGSLIVASLSLSGRVCLWEFPADWDDQQQQQQQDNGTTGGRPIRAAIEFDTQGTTGTTLLLCPPRLAGVGDVVVALGGLDGRIQMIATGLVTPQYTKKEPTLAGTVLDYWGSAGSALPLSLSWHPTQAHQLVVGRQNGQIDLLTGSRKQQHRLTQQQQGSSESSIRAVAVSPDGHLLVAGSDAGWLTVWDLQRPVPTLVHHVRPDSAESASCWILGIAFLSDSRRFCTLGTDRKIHVWEVSQLHNQPVHTFATEMDQWTMQAFTTVTASSSNAVPATRLVTASDTGWLQVFSLEHK